MGNSMFVEVEITHTILVDEEVLEPCLKKFRQEYSSRYTTVYAGSRWVNIHVIDNNTLASLEIFKEWFKTAPANLKDNILASWKKGGIDV